MIQYRGHDRGFKLIQGTMLHQCKNASGTTIYTIIMRHIATDSLTTAHNVSFSVNQVSTVATISSAIYFRLGGSQL